MRQPSTLTSSSVSGSTIAGSYASARQLTRQRRRETGREGHARQPPLHLVGLRLDRGGDLGADLLEEPEGDRAVTAMGPRAHDPAVRPDRRPGVADGVEARGTVGTEVP